MLHVVPCGQRGYGFVRPVWNTRCMLHVVSSGLRSFRDASCGFVLPAWSAT